MAKIEGKCRLCGKREAAFFLPSTLLPVCGECWKAHKLDFDLMERINNAANNNVNANDVTPAISERGRKKRSGKLDGRSTKNTPDLANRYRQDSGVLFDWKADT